MSTLRYHRKKSTAVPVLSLLALFEYTPSMNIKWSTLLALIVALAVVGGIGYSAGLTRSVARQTAAESDRPVVFPQIVLSEPEVEPVTPVVSTTSSQSTTATATSKKTDPVPPIQTEPSETPLPTPSTPEQPVACAGAPNGLHLNPHDRAADAQQFGYSLDQSIDRVHLIVRLFQAKNLDVAVSASELAELQTSIDLVKHHYAKAFANCLTVTADLATTPVQGALRDDDYRSRWTIVDEVFNQTQAVAQADAYNVWVVLVLRDTQDQFEHVVLVGDDPGYGDGSRMPVPSIVDATTLFTGDGVPVKSLVRESGFIAPPAVVDSLYGALGVSSSGVWLEYVDSSEILNRPYAIPLPRQAAREAMGLQAAN